MDVLLPSISSSISRCCRLSERPRLGTLTFCLKDVNEELAPLCNKRSMAVASLTFAGARGLDLSVCIPTEHRHWPCNTSSVHSELPHSVCIHMSMYVSCLKPFRLKACCGCFRFTRPQSADATWTSTPPISASFHPPKCLNQQTYATSNLLISTPSAEQAATIIPRWPTKVSSRINQIRRKGICIFFVVVGFFFSFTPAGLISALRQRAGVWQ